MRTYFGFCNLLDLPDILIRHDTVEPDDVWAVPFILLFEGGDDQLGRPVAIMVPTEKPLPPLWCPGSTEQQVYVMDSSVCRHQPHSLGPSPPSSLRKEKKSIMEHKSFNIFSVRNIFTHIYKPLEGSHSYTGLKKTVTIHLKWVWKKESFSSIQLPIMSRGDQLTSVIEPFNGLLSVAFLLML